MCGLKSTCISQCLLQRHLKCSLYKVHKQRCRLIRVSGASIVNCKNYKIGHYKCASKSRKSESRSTWIKQAQIQRQLFLSSRNTKRCGKFNLGAGGSLVALHLSSRVAVQVQSGVVEFRVSQQSLWRLSPGHVAQISRFELPPLGP